MKLKPHIPFILLLFLPIVFYVIMNFSSINYYPFLEVYFWGFLICSLVFPVVYFILSIVQLLKKEYWGFVYSILIGCLFALILIKIQFEYYNFFLVIIFLFVILYLTFRINKKTLNNIKIEGKKIFLYELIVFNFLIGFIPDESIRKNLLSDDLIIWGKDLSWSDFRRDPKTIELGNGYSISDTTFDAEIHTGLEITINRLYNYRHAIILATMDTKKSWVGLEMETKYLLEHEQMHFNLCEIFKRKIDDSLSQYWVLPPNKTLKIIDYFLNERDKANKLYDSVTSHGGNKFQQCIWNKKIIKNLNN